MTTFGGFGATGTPFGAPAQQQQQQQDYRIQLPQGTDTVSSLAWSPVSGTNTLVAGTWDNKVMCWNVQKGMGSLQATPQASISHTQPVLDVHFTGDGRQVVSASADKTAKLWDLGQPGHQGQQIAVHDQPIRCARFIPQMSAVVTGSWDRTLKYWDMRQPTPVGQVNLPERCYALDVVHPLLVVATAEKHIVAYNLQNFQVEYDRFASPLKHQSRCIAAFPDQRGFALGSIEGRVAIHHVQSTDTPKNFAFKCHRSDPKQLPQQIFPVNAISFHKQHGTFSTAGADGTFNFWDKDSKQRLKAFGKQVAAITATGFNATGDIFAYGVGYDWLQGVQGKQQAPQPYIALHDTPEREIKPRPAAGGHGHGRRGHRR